jgi:hypothetical protein
MNEDLEKRRITDTNRETYRSIRFALLFAKQSLFGQFLEFDSKSAQNRRVLALMTSQPILSIYL